jgi:GH25 family lysozyme M1 (1,4-beta-N-acetylmuramidase)
MKKGIVSAITLTLLLASMLMATFHVQPVQTELTQLTVAEEPAAMQGTMSLASQEPPPTEWNKTYGGTRYDEPRALVQTVDGGYALAGYTDSYGTGDADFWLVKTDASGNMQWNKTYGGTYFDLGLSMVQTSDGGYAIAGYTWFSYGAVFDDFWLVRTDSTGNHLWNKTYGGSNSDYAWSLIQTDDGGYALAGSTESFGAGDADFWLVKTDANGNEQWNKTYGGTDQDRAYALVQTNDGGYALAGWTESYGAGYRNSWLVKTDANGNALWDRTYGGTDYDYTIALVQTADGGYALAGITSSYDVGSGDWWLVKSDATGDMQWNKTYGGTDQDCAYALVQTSDGGYALAGYTYSFGYGSPGDFYLVKTDASGNMQWNKTYGGTDQDQAWALVETDDGGYAIAGSTEFLGAGSYDAWLIKTAAPPAPVHVQGIDVSHYQGEITWSEVYEANYRFAYAKASEGNGLQDPNFADNMLEGRGAGLFMGAYHLGRPDLGNSAHDEAHFFVNTAYGYLTSGYLRPVLRVSTGASMGKEALSNWIIQWVEEVRSLTNAEPLIQVTSEYANYYLNPSLAQYDLWISDWTYDPSTPPNTGEIWDTWSFWQYSNLGSVPGIEGNVFLDLFNGTNDDLQKMLLFLPPEADFTYSPKKPLIRETITFNASSSHDPNGRILLYAWSTTDGQTYISQEPTWETYFARAGEYTVTLEVVDNDNQRDTKSFRVKVSKDWTFAVITDIHMGYNYTDYGTLSWNDEGGQEPYQLTTRLRTIVNWINSHEESNNIHFVAVLGDISDSGEKSELLKARDILDDLNIPYIPVIGNHDIWPYTQQVSTTDVHKPEYYWQDWRTTKGLYPTVQLPPGSAETAVGDEFFDEVFWPQNGVNREKIEALFGNSWKRQTEQTGYAGLLHIQNCVFVYKNVKFIALDFIDRNPEEDTQSSCGKLNLDTERWLTDNSVKNEPTVLLSHHAIEGSTSASWIGTDRSKVRNIITKSECNLLANFAGHNHRNADFVSTWPGVNIKAVTTEAVCRESISLLADIDGEGFVTRQKNPIRLVNMTWDKQMKSYRTQVYINDEDIIVPKWWNNLFRVNCPVDLTVTDPDGFTITKEIGAIAGMFYLERDWDGDGDLDDLVTLDFLKPGNYQISVTPEPGALPNDTYTLLVFGSDAVTVLAENVSISDIPAEPYIVNSTVFTLNIPPTTSIEIGEPKIVNGTTYVSPATPIDLTASDNPYGSGLASTAYRIYNATFDTGWTMHTSTICLAGLSEDAYQIDYYSTDCAGNVEPASNVTVVLENPNISVTNTTLSKAIVGQGFSLYVNATIQNQGPFTEIFDVTFYANATIIDTVTDIVIASGNFTTITFIWNSSGFALGNYTLSFYAWPILGETNIQDNNFTGGTVRVGIPGDVDPADGYVGIDDIFSMASHFSDDPSSPEWNPNRDINGDDYVGIDDIFTAASHFGQEENP